MNPILKRILEAGKSTSENGAEYVMHSTVTPQVGEFLQDLIREIKPKNSLEIGLGYGVSALYICDALKEPGIGGRHVTIDPFQYTIDSFGKTFDGIGMYNLRKAGYADIVEFLDKPSAQALSGLIAEGRKFQFAFIDGWHTFDHALIDFFLIDQLLDVGGVVCFDDANWPSVRKVCRYVVTNRSYSVFKTSGNETDSALRKILVFLVHCLKPFKGLLRFLKPEILISDSDLGLKGACICLRKEAGDKRLWDAHRDF